MQMPSDAAEQLAHETRLRDDIDYAVKCRTESIFNDLKEFNDLMSADGALELVQREFLRALYLQRYGKKDMYIHIHDAISNCNDAIDAKILQIVESER